MSPWIDAAQVEVHPGDGLVGRWPGIIVVIPSGVELSSTVEHLFPEGAAAPEVIRERAEALGSHQPVAVVLEQPQPDRIWVYCSGVPCWASGESFATGGATIDAVALRIGEIGEIAEDASAVAPAAHAVGHPAIGLCVGLVPGAGASITAIAAIDQSAGHAQNDAPVSNPTNVVPAVKGAPSFGRIVFDDGSEFSLECSYAIGRVAGAELPEGFRPIVLDDAEHTISRRHAEIHVREESVVLTDLGSTNGTHVLDPASNEWSRLVPNVPAVLDPGARVAVGGRQFVLEEQS